MINLRDEFEEMKKDWGYPLLLQRQSKVFKCKCQQSKQDIVLNNTIVKCNICNDSGMIVKLEKVTGIKMNASEDALKQADFGQYASPLFEVYFDYSQPVQRGDKIYEVGWKDNIPISLHNIYDVIYHEYVRGDRGRIEFIMLIVQEKNVNMMETERDFLRNVSAYRNDFIKKGV